MLQWGANNPVDAQACGRTTAAVQLAHAIKVARTYEYNYNNRVFFSNVFFTFPTEQRHQTKDSQSCY